MVVRLGLIKRLIKWLLLLLRLFCFWIELLFMMNHDDHFSPSQNVRVDFQTWPDWLLVKSRDWRLHRKRFPLSNLSWMKIKNGQKSQRQPATNTLLLCPFCIPIICHLPACPTPNHCYARPPKTLGKNQNFTDSHLQHRFICFIYCISIFFHFFQWNTIDFLRHPAGLAHFSPSSFWIQPICLVSHVAAATVEVNRQ